jgi:hypothetical protein
MNNAPSASKLTLLGANPTSPRDAAEPSLTSKKLIDFAVDSVKRAGADDMPFHHLKLQRVFPDHFYMAMMRAMPLASDYRVMSGKTKVGSSRPDRKPTRTKIDLFPEYIRHFSPEKRAVWDGAGAVLRSQELKMIFMQRLAPGLERRFGTNFAKMRMYPVPILTRDIPGYRIFKHTDTLWKGITVQLYLPPDNSTPHIGTIFHEILPDGKKAKKTQMPFLPNTGYAFAVGNNTWHSVDPVGPEVKTRDSILLTYFVDAGMWRFLRNRGRRMQNVVLNEMRNVKRKGAFWRAS